MVAGTKRSRGAIGMVTKILCVAEKPSIAKAVANHLGASVSVRNSAGPGWLKNYEFSFTFNQPWGISNVVMTSVAGHINSVDFDSRYRGWHSCQPSQLFEAPLVTYVENEKKSIAKNIETNARHARALFIWTDCDREGEHIGSEIRDIALKVNSHLDVKRARFSNTERAHVVQAARAPIPLDDKQANAVAARIELDLRIGASFTRWQTLSLKPMIEHLDEELGPISYGIAHLDKSTPLKADKTSGSCQFPTLGFVVDRYFRVKSFRPETFWRIQVWHNRDDKRVAFNWSRGHLFDRMVVTLLFERCINSGAARVSSLEKKPTSKWRPLPLTTVELQKMGSRFLRMDSQRVMKLAEELYQRGFLSYPRTETDQFSHDMDLRTIVAKQTSDNSWGGYAQTLLDGAYRQPRGGRNNDQAHPPIHPVNHPSDSDFRSVEERRVYEFVTRRFLACCSEDAKGESTIVSITWADELFTARGLRVIERNYLDVYPYDKWESTQELPQFTMGERFVPSEAKMTEGKTSPPGYLTEPELIALMDANGIGTDATMAEHIAKIKERRYVETRAPGGAAAVHLSDEEGEPPTRGGGRGRGRGRGGRGSAATGRTASRGGSGGNAIFIPTNLGVALIKGYERIEFAETMSLSKPHLRKEAIYQAADVPVQMEQQMRAICAGTTNRNEVVQISLEKYREVFIRSAQQVGVLKESLRRYVLGEGPPN
ncbi:MAG: DNA topoisomerase [Chrysothrix sp. TS-e1954]|nr:MAG: DNA topoisomerase [Chrysothrix sp. TS-e1954]